MFLSEKSSSLFRCVEVLGRKRRRSSVAPPEFDVFKLRRNPRDSASVQAQRVYIVHQFLKELEAKEQQEIIRMNNHCFLAKDIDEPSKLEQQNQGMVSE